MSEAKGRSIWLKMGSGEAMRKYATVIKKVGKCHGISGNFDWR